ncbi:Uncharacterised protein [Morganella morganii]|uniref:hypothetical protein n=1 Tax=Morganella morganii TaxID=582 RepID=UPI000D92966C|nr:hypothetical protein [Morganella morganii]SPX94989.1 Uncharacterised protein [Morganella morganii]
MDISRQQFEEWRSQNKTSTIDLFDVWKASRDAMEPVAFTIIDDTGYLYLNRMTTQEGDELNHQLNLLQKYCPEKQYSITPLYRLDK